MWVLDSSIQYIYIHLYILGGRKKREKEHVKENIYDWARLDILSPPMLPQKEKGKLIILIFLIIVNTQHERRGFCDHG